MYRIAAAAMLAVLVAIPATAGEFNKKVKIGDTAPTFSSLPGVDGKEHSLADCKTDAVVVVITCNHCPMAIAYEDRIIALAKKYEGKASIVAINVNNLEADKLPKMKERAKEKGITYPYLYDESQEIGAKLGASVTPEVFVFSKGKIVYIGAFDDNMKADKVSKHYVADAVDAALAGKDAPVSETRPVGCGVRYNK